MKDEQEQFELDFQDFEANHNIAADDEDSNDIWRFFCTVFTRDQKPLLKKHSLAIATVDLLKSTLLDCNVQLWSYVVLPDSVQFVVEVDEEKHYHECVEAFKSSSEKTLVEIINNDHENLIDDITFYNPAWKEPSFLVWQAGYHTQLLSSMYVLSNKIADIVTKPVVLGLVERPEDWVFSSYQANTNDEIETE